jgi:excisionase family DNA binding protein
MTDTDQPTTPRTMLTPEQAAEALGIGRTTMFALIKSGEIESVRVGRLRRVPLDSIEAYTNRLITEQNHEGA